MKQKIKAAVACGGLSLSLCVGASEFYTNATNLWYQGRQTEALSMAEARLAANTNDLAALIVRASYDFDFSGAAAVSNSFTKVLALGPTVRTRAFRQRYVVLRKMCERTLDYVAREDPVRLQTEQLKVSGPGQYMRFYFALRALEEDGLIED